MAKIVLYHGTPEEFRQPVFGKGKDNNDYGRGFYMTEHIELAKEWASNKNLADGYVNKYELELDGLSILNLSDKQYSILNWLAILVQNRRINGLPGVSKKGMKWLADHFTPDYLSYDIILGYRADDSYFRFGRSFLANGITLRQLAKCMHLGKLGEQYCLKSKEAFDAILHTGNEKVNAKEYYRKRLYRENAANAEYDRIVEEYDKGGIRLSTIVDEEMLPGDPRLDIPDEVFGEE
ncbi:MAG: DUF3990 domain-containing protein [Clostridia bacterium]|nr:DUF3990 domain-containing protein [Clostridia bacterium]